MPKKYRACVQDVKDAIVTGKVKQYYKKNGQKLKSNPFAICNKFI